jgi:hypothetical protein
MIQRIFAKGEVAWTVALGSERPLIIKCLVLEDEAGIDVKTTIGIMPSYLLLRDEPEARKSVMWQLARQVEEARRTLASLEAQLKSEPAVCDATHPKVDPPRVNPDVLLFTNQLRARRENFIAGVGEALKRIGCSLSSMELGRKGLEAFWSMTYYAKDRVLQTTYYPLTDDHDFYSELVHDALVRRAENSE